MLDDTKALLRGVALGTAMAVAVILPLPWLIVGFVWYCEYVSRLFH
jgi:hypothetical protein